MSRHDMPQDSRLPADPYHYVPRQPQAVAHDGSLTVPARPVYGRQVLFGDDATRAAHLRRCRAIEQTMNERWQVAPAHCVRLLNGHVLRAGDTVRPEHFAHPDEQRSALLIIGTLVQKGVVLQSDALDPDQGPSAA